MRKILIVVVGIALIAGAAAVYLIVTTPRQTAGIRALVAQVPASADSFAIIPSAGTLDAKLRANPVTREALESWSGRQSIPRPWMLGGADLLAWKSGDSIRYFLRLDPFRAFLVRVYSMGGGELGQSIRINVAPEGAIDSAEVAHILDLASKLPPGDALVVQRESARGSFPPIPRPSVTSVQVTATEVNLVSVGAAAPGRPSPAATLTAHLPRAAVFAAAFTSPPRIVGDLNRLLGAKVSAILADGGAIALYDVDAGKLLPRPIGVIAVPSDHRAAFDSLVSTLHGGESLGYRVHTAEGAGQLLLSFDESINQYLIDQFDDTTVAGGQWTLVIDPQRLVPILGRLSDSVGLRIASPRLFRSARDLNGWIAPLQRARSIEATDSVQTGLEQLRVHLTAK
ncbi:MAG TPA: hypothetical protein VIO12_12155 [Thermoanaerobaculia bacterium]